MNSRNRMDLNQYISLHINALKRCGLWLYIPHAAGSMKFWVKVVTKVALGILVFFLSTGGQIVYLVKYTMFGEAKIQEIAGIANLILTELMTSFKLLDLRMRRHRIMRVLRLLDNWPLHGSTQVEVHGRAIRLARNLFLWLLFSSYIDVIVHTMTVPALNRFQTLPLKMDLIFLDVNQQPYFNYAFAYQILYKPIMVTSFVILQSLPWALMLHAISELNILSNSIKITEKQVKLVKYEKKCSDNEAFKIVLGKCVDHYNIIAGFVKDFQSAFSGQFTISILMIVCILGATGVQILSTESLLYQLSDVVWISMYMVIFILMSFIDCYFGNTIAVKSLQVATDLYSSPWTSQSPQFQRDVMMAMVRSQRPLIVTAAQRLPISLETFTDKK